MKLYNFTNHDQSEYAEVFNCFGFNEITAPLHPDIDVTWTEEEIEDLVNVIIRDSGMLNNSCVHVLIQGMTNVCYYMLKRLSLQSYPSVRAYYVKTERIRDENNKFIFKPVALAEYLL